MKNIELVYIAFTMIVLGVWLDVIKSATKPRSDPRILSPAQLQTYLEGFEPYEPVVVESILKDFASKNINGNVVDFSMENIITFDAEYDGIIASVVNGTAGAFSSRIRAVPVFKFSDTFIVKGKPVVVRASGRTTDESVSNARSAIETITRRVRQRL